MNTPNLNPTSVSEQNKNKFNLKFEIFRYIQYWYWFVLSVFIVLFAAYFYLRYTPNVYATQGKIKILDNSSNSFKMPSMGGVSLFARPRVNLENEIEVLKSYLINEKVVKSLNLTDKYIKIGYFSEIVLWQNEPFEIDWKISKDSLNLKGLSFEIELEKNGFRIIDELHSEKFTDLIKYGTAININKIAFSINIKNGISNAKGKYRIVHQPIKQVTNSLIKSLSISNVGSESEVLSLTMNGENPKKTEAIINKLIDLFDLDGVRDRQKVSERTIEFVKDRFISLTKELDSIEFGKANYKSKNLLSFINEDASIAASRKEVAHDELLKMEIQVELAKILDQLLQSKIEQLLPGDLGIDNMAINQMISDYNKIILDKDRLKNSAGQNHPTVNLYSNQLRDLRENLFVSIGNYRKQLKVSLQKLSDIETRSLNLYSTIPEKERVLRAIERQQQIKESLYLILLQKREEAAINLAITEPSIKVVDYAITNTVPLSPKRSIILLGSFVIGLFFPFVILYLYFMSDTKIHVKDDLLAILPSLTVAAEIPHLEKDKMVMDANDRSVLGEAFRILRTNISYLLPLKEGNKAHIIFTTSTVKGEGKTFTSTNTAMAFTALNKNVLLIGADVRNPQLHKLLNVDKNQKGLTNYLYDQKVTWQETRNKGALGNHNLDVIFSGPIPPNPAELLSNGRLEKLLEEAKDMYDYIIVDTAPTILVTDTLLISQLADVTLYMVRANFTDKNLLNFIKELNDQKKLKNMAFVLNDIGAGKAYGYGYGYGYGYKYNYAYNYGYGYGYSEEVGGEKKKKSLLKRIFKA